jgi:hypothetical protein
MHILRPHRPPNLLSKVAVHLIFSTENATDPAIEISQEDYHRPAALDLVPDGTAAATARPQ